LAPALPCSATITTHHPQQQQLLAASASANNATTVLGDDELHAGGDHLDESDDKIPNSTISSDGTLDAAAASFPPLRRCGNIKDSSSNNSNNY